MVAAYRRGRPLSKAEGGDEWFEKNFRGALGGWLVCVKGGEGGEVASAALLRRTPPPNLGPAPRPSLKGGGEWHWATLPLTPGRRGPFLRPLRSRCPAQCPPAWYLWPHVGPPCRGVAQLASQEEEFRRCDAAISTLTPQQRRCICCAPKACAIARSQMCWGLEYRRFAIWCTGPSCG